MVTSADTGVTLSTLLYLYLHIDDMNEQSIQMLPRRRVAL